MRRGEPVRSLLRTHSSITTRSTTKLFSTGFYQSFQHRVSPKRSFTMSTSAQEAAPWPPLQEKLILKGYETTAMPTLIYGTAWKAEKTADFVYKAIKAGFRGIDTAGQPKHYKEPLVGEGIRKAINEGIVTRKDLYVSKLSSSPCTLKHWVYDVVMCILTPCDPQLLLRDLKADLKAFSSDSNKILSSWRSRPQRHAI